MVFFCTHSCSFFQNEEEEEEKNTIIEPNLTYNRILPAAILPLVLSNFFKNHHNNITLPAAFLP